MMRLRNLLKKNVLLWEYLRRLKHFVNIILNPFYRIYYSILISKFIDKHKIDRSKYVLFSHGSVGDTLYMASLLDDFSKKYGEFSVLASKQHTDIYRIFVNEVNVNFIWVEEAECIKLREAISFTRVYEDGLSPGIIRPLHGVLYRHFLELLTADRLGYRDSMTWIMGLDKNIPHRYASYNSLDKNVAKSLLSNAEKNVDIIALINPICYTHRNISISAWLGVANALITCGYKPVFNLKQNANDKNKIDVPAGFPVIEIPAYLVPACANLVGISCARNGGGFDLLHSFNSNSNSSLLISLSPQVKISENEKPDPEQSILDRFYVEFSGKNVTNAVFLNSDNDEQEAYSKVVNVLTHNAKKID